MRYIEFEIIGPPEIRDVDPNARYFGEGGGDSPERLRAIMIAHRAA